MSGNLRLYPWFQFFRNMLFWQATWFLYFQGKLSAAEAILLYAVYDLSSTLLEVPSGYLSDKVGRRITLILSAISASVGTLLLATGDSFAAFALGQCLIGVGAAFVSGTDSSLLFESLARDGRAEEVEDHELRAWRFGFFGLALSAVTGGAMAMGSGAAPFWASVATSGVMVLIAVRFTEPPHLGPAAETRIQLQSLGVAFRNPALLWLLGLGVLMYGFSHIPFVFGQPLILEVLTAQDQSEVAPMVSGAISAVMMLISLGASWLAPALKRALGLATMLLIAFSMQVALVGVMTMGESLIVVAFLMLRMAPDAFAQPFIAAAMQPHLSDNSRATFLSLRSLAARLLFAASLSALSVRASGEASMSYAEIQSVLSVYLIAGLIGVATLALTAKSLGGAKPTRVDETSRSPRDGEDRR